MIKLSDYLQSFDEKYKNLKYIDKEWYENEVDVVSFCKKAATRDTKGNYSEEYRVYK